jgi:hypothetical protein
MRLLTFLAASILALPAHANVTQPLPPSLAFEALSETMPTAVAPAEFSADDFALEWDGPAIPGMSVKLQSRSLEWVRVQDVLVIPRARARFYAERAAKGSAHQAGFSQPFVYEISKEPGGKTQPMSAEIPVALLSGVENEIQVEVLDTSASGMGTPPITRGKLRVRFRPRPETARGPLWVDPSCSRFGVTMESQGAAQQEDWLYVGCRLVGVEGAEHRTSSLELFTLWEGVGNSISVEDLPTPQTSASVWLLRLRSQPGSVRLRGGEREVTVHYGTPENLHRGSLGAGLGPYSYLFQSSTEETKSGTAMLTLYGSYQLYDTIRAVAFDATTFSSQMVTDLGLYVNAEQFRTFDRRVALNLMLGAHVIGFKTQGEYLVVFGAPQGIELIVTDFLGKNRNLGAGAFIYPSIGGKAYYNTWLRWGSPSFFGEINYISWEENLENRGRFYSQSLGISLGFPLARFL